MMDADFTHTYRVNLEGTGLKLLDPGDASHGSVTPDTGKCFLTTYWPGLQIRRASSISKRRSSSLWPSASSSIVSVARI